MADTDYALLPALKARLMLDAGDHPPDVMLRGLLNTAARVVDAVTRRPPDNWPYPAFSISGAITRRYADPYTGDEAIPLDDLYVDADNGFPVLITRGGVELTADTDYLLWPWDDQPKTRLYLAPGAGARGVGSFGSRQNVAITGYWGYCPLGSRPPEIAEATLLQAVIFYQRYGLDVETLANAQGDPLSAADKTVTRMLLGVTRR